MNKVMYESVAKTFLEKIAAGDNQKALQKVTEILESSILDIKTSAPAIYESVLSFPRPDQYNILETYLMLECTDPAQEFVRCVQKLPDLIETALVMQEDCYVDPIDIQALRESVNDLDVDAPGWQDRVASFLRKTLLWVGGSAGVLALLKWVTNSGLFASFGWSALLLVILLSSRYAAKDAMSMVADFLDFLKLLYDCYKKFTNPFKYAFVLAYKNEEHCYVRAGVPKNTPNILTMISLMSGSPEKGAMAKIMPRIATDQADKLRDCFLESLLERGAIFFGLYFDCLRKTGDWNKLNISDDKLVQLFRAIGSAQDQCSEYLKNAQKSIKIFHDILNVVYRNDSKERAKWETLLNRYIIDARSEYFKKNRPPKDRFGNDPNSRGNRLGRNMIEHD